MTMVNQTTDVTAPHAAKPELKRDDSAVRDRLLAAGAGAAVLETWAQLVAEPIAAEDEDD